MQLACLTLHLVCTMNVHRIGALHQTRCIFLVRQSSEVTTKVGQCQ